MRPTVTRMNRKSDKKLWLDHGSKKIERAILKTSIPYPGITEIKNYSVNAKAGNTESRITLYIMFSHQRPTTSLQI